MNLLIVNCTYETFTPSNSGAICTWIREICRVAEGEGTSPLLISRRSEHPQYDRPDTLWIDYPEIPVGALLERLAKLQRRMCGWVRLRQGAYVAEVVKAIWRAGAEEWPILLHNDMELGVSLRSAFPRAKILHLSHNLNGTTSRYRRRFGSSVDVPLAVSDYARRWNEEFYHLAPGAMKTLHNGVDINAFHPATNKTIDKPTIGFVGKLDRNKAPDLLLKAALQLAARRRDFSIQIVGRKLYDRVERDEYTAELDRLAAELAKAGVECRLVGWVDHAELPTVLNAANIHVTPSRWDEPFGLTTLEAMACGLAVIGSNTGGTPEVIGEAGLLFERDNVAQLADHLERLLNDHSLITDFGRRARVRAEQFSWANTWHRLKQFIDLPQ